MIKQLDPVKRLKNCVEEMSDILNNEEYECMNQLYRSRVYKNDKSNDYFSECFINILIDGKINPSKIDKKVLYSLLKRNTKLFRQYYNILNESQKVLLIGSLDYPTILFIDSKDLDNNNNVYGNLKYLTIGSPSSLLRKLYIFPTKYSNHNYVKSVHDAKTLYLFVEQYFNFYFKYIEIQKLNKGILSIAFLSNNPEYDYSVKAVVKRISMFQEKKISKNSIKSFIEFISNPKDVSPESRKIFMDALNTYIPEKIMVDLSL